MNYPIGTLELQSPECRSAGSLWALSTAGSAAGVLWLTCVHGFSLQGGNCSRERRRGCGGPWMVLLGEEEAGSGKRRLAALGNEPGAGEDGRDGGLKFERVSPLLLNPKPCVFSFLPFATLVNFDKTP